MASLLCLLLTCFEFELLADLRRGAASGCSLESRRCFDSNGERVYMGFASGEWLEQKLVQHCHAKGFQATASHLLCSMFRPHPLDLLFCRQKLGVLCTGPLATVQGLILYSQANDNMHHYHPIIMYLAKFTLQDQACWHSSQSVPDRCCKVGVHHWPMLHAARSHQWQHLLPQPLGGEHC